MASLQGNRSKTHCHQNCHRRSGNRDLFQRQHRRPQRCNADSFQYRIEHSTGFAGLHARRQRQDPRYPAFLSLLWIYGRLVDARGERHRRCLPSQPVGREGDQRTRRQIQGHIPDRNTNLSAGLYEALLAGELRQPAICSGRRGKAAGACCAGL